MSLDESRASLPGT